MTWYDDMHRRLDALERFEAEIKERMPSARVLGHGSGLGRARVPEFFLELDSGRDSWIVRAHTNFSGRDSWTVAHWNPFLEVMSKIGMTGDARAAVSCKSADFCDQSAAIGHVLELLRAEPDAVRRAPSP